MSDSGSVDGADAEDAFALLADETRLAIIRELYALEEPLTFSELGERVGMRDSGQFNYHLGKLTSRFVEQTDDGYTLTMAGLRVLGAVFAGAYDEATTIEPISIDDPCPVCDGDLVAVYDRDHFKITCEDCERQIVAYPAPPGILRGRDRTDLPDVFSRYATHVLGQITDGFCPLCLGTTTAELGAEPTDGVGVTYRCDHCGLDMSMSAVVALLTVPAAVAFARDHGIEIDKTPIWNNPLFDSDERLIEDESGPAVLELSLTLDDETLTVQFDDQLSALETTRF